MRCPVGASRHYSDCSDECKSALVVGEIVGGLILELNDKTGHGKRGLSGGNRSVGSAAGREDDVHQHPASTEPIRRGSRRSDALHLFVR